MTTEHSGGDREAAATVATVAEHRDAGDESTLLSLEQLDADGYDLSSGLGELATIVGGSLPLADLLTRVSAAAALAIPRTDGVGVTLLRLDQDENRVQALGASQPFVSQVDAIQYELVNEGPCITAALDQVPVWSGSLGGDRRWPRFGPRAGRLGVHSVLSLPLILPDGKVVGAVNAYAYAKEAFDEHAAQLGQLYSAAAAVAIYNAQLLDQAVTRATQLQTALTSRATIDQAIGILRSRGGGTIDEAFARLRHISQTEHTKIAVVAERLVAEAVRRAHARHKPT